MCGDNSAVAYDDTTLLGVALLCCVASAVLCTPYVCLLVCGQTAATSLHNDDGIADQTVETCCSQAVGDAR